MTTEYLYKAEEDSARFRVCAPQTTQLEHLQTT